MKGYTCPTCDRVILLKHNYDRHINKKNKCKKINKDIDNLADSLLQSLNISEDKPKNKIPDLDLLKTTLENKNFQKGLLQLYADSQKENTRNCKLGMEVGISRERDLVSVLKYFLPDKINSDVDNALPEDFLLNSLKISVKHKQGAIGSAFKVSWTCADNAVKSTINSMINASDNYYPHLLVAYIENINQKITIICITAEENKNIIKSLKENAFKTIKNPKGNTRGIEYSKEAMNKLIKNKYFEVVINNADLTKGKNPIQRRIDVLKSMNITP